MKSKISINWEWLKKSYQSIAPEHVDQLIKILLSEKILGTIYELRKKWGIPAEKAFPNSNPFLDDVDNRLFNKDIIKEIILKFKLGMNWLTFFRNFISYGDFSKLPLSKTEVMSKEYIGEQFKNQYESLSLEDKEKVNGINFGTFQIYNDKKKNKTIIEADPGVNINDIKNTLKYLTFFNKKLGKVNNPTKKGQLSDLVIWRDFLILECLSNNIIKNKDIIVVIDKEYSKQFLGKCRPSANSSLTNEAIEKAVKDMKYILKNV